MTEKLASVAIIRNGETHSRGFKSHGELRSALGDSDAWTQRHRPDDNEGFLTSEGRFVSREAAVRIGIASGQLGRMWERGGRPLLSSDINW